MTITVRDRREDIGWNQKELAKEANVSKSTVWRAENKIAITRLNAKKIARALDIPLKELEIQIVE